MKELKRESKFDELLNNKEVIDLSLSYSKISEFDRKGPISLVKREIVDNEGIRFGSIVDDLLVDKVTGSDLFKNKYYKYDSSKPTASLGELCDIILNNYQELPNKAKVLEIVKESGLWKKTKNDDKLTSYFNVPKFWEYLKVKYDVTGKIVITSKDYMDALECVNILLNHKYSYVYFNNSYENHYQYSFTILYKNFTIKGIIDKLTIDHKNKKVYMEDIKTGSFKGEEFISSFLKYRYYFQGAIYTLAFDKICEELKLENYTLEPFKFIYLGRYERIPHIYIMNSKWYNAAIKGFKLKSGYIYRGLDECLNNIYFHWKNKLYESSKKMYEQNGCLILNDDFIEVN